MTDIDRLLNTTSAGLLAQKLNAMDGNAEDKQISASIWNEFVKDKGGKEVREFISVEDAMKSITTYVIRESKRLGKSVENLIQEWQPTGSAPAPGGSSAPAATSSPEATEGEREISQSAEAAKQKQVQQDYNSVKVTVPNRPSQADMNAVAKNQKEGKKLRNALKAGETQGITPGNAAHALGKTIFGPNTQEQAKVVFSALVDRMSELGIFEDGKDYGSWYSVSKLPYDKQNSLIINYAKRIIAKENEMVRLFKSQKVFDDATKFMAEVANMEPKPEIKKGHNDKDNYDWAHAKLPDGRYIEVCYDSDGKISNVRISHDTTPNHKSDGTTYDGVEVEFNKDKARFDTDKSNDTFEGSITSGYDFEKLKALAEKIFGKKE